MEATEVLKLVNCALNVPLALTTTLGNALILAAIWKTPSLHSATNALVFGLALSDLGVGLISQPLAIFKLSKLFGKSKELTLIFQMFSVSFASVSLLTVTAIGVDRYLALRLHLRYQELQSVEVFAFSSLCGWVASVSLLLHVFGTDTFLGFIAQRPL